MNITRMYNLENVTYNDGKELVRGELINNEYKQRENIAKLIKGDNLYVMDKLIEQGEKYNVIYIDPPYNTGNVFSYNDKFKDSNELKYYDYMKFLGERLIKVKELMTDDGMVFLQIGKRMQAYVKILMDDIFGEDNFIENIVWLNKAGGLHTSNYFNSRQEYILVYTKNKNNNLKSIKYLRRKDGDIKSYEYDDNDGYGKYKWQKFINTGMTVCGNCHYDIEIDGKIYNPKKQSKNGAWRYAKDMWELYYNKGFYKVENGFIYVKSFYNYNSKLELKDKIGLAPYSFIEQYSTSNGTRQLYKFNNGYRVFEYPKPVGLIKELISYYNKNTFKVLDIFGGSGTTFQAVKELIDEDDFNIDSTIVTLGECTDILLKNYLNTNNYIKGSSDLLYKEFIKDENNKKLLDRLIKEEDITIYNYVLKNRVSQLVNKDEYKNKDSINVYEYVIK